MFERGGNDQTVRHRDLSPLKALLSGQGPPAFRYGFVDGQNPSLKPGSHHVIKPFSEFSSALALRESGDSLTDLPNRDDAQVDVLPTGADEEVLNDWIGNWLGQLRREVRVDQI